MCSEPEIVGMPPPAELVPAKIPPAREIPVPYAVPVEPPPEGERVVGW